MDKRNNEKVSKLWGYWNIAEAILLISAGVLAIVFGSLIKADDASSTSSKAIELTLSIVIGLFVAMDGLLRIILVLARVKDSEQPIMLIGGFCKKRLRARNVCWQVLAWCWYLFFF